MNFLELNRVITGNYDGCAESKRGPIFVTKEEVQEFLGIFYVDPYIKSVFDATENYQQFYDTFPWFKKVFEAVKAKELFYAAKCETIYEGVPPTIVFLFKKALMQYEYKFANLALNRIDRRLLEPYMKSGVLNSEVTYKDVIENIIGKSVKLITASSPCVDVDGVSELYVPNIDAVALVPTDMLKDISDLEDYNSVVYDKGVGLTVKGQPIRTMGGKVGLTKNDLDLRNCL